MAKQCLNNSVTAIALSDFRPDSNSSIFPIATLIKVRAAKPESLSFRRLLDQVLAHLHT